MYYLLSYTKRKRKTLLVGQTSKPFNSWKWKVNGIFRSDTLKCWLCTWVERSAISKQSWRYQFTVLTDTHGYITKRCRAPEWVNYDVIIRFGLSYSLSKYFDLMDFLPLLCITDNLCLKPHRVDYCHAIAWQMTKTQLTIKVFWCWLIYNIIQLLSK